MKTILVLMIGLYIAGAHAMDPTDTVTLTITYAQMYTSPDLASDVYTDVNLESSIPIYNQTTFRFYGTPNNATLVCQKLGYKNGYDRQWTMLGSGNFARRAQYDQNLKVSLTVAQEQLIDLGCLK